MGKIIRILRWGWRGIEVWDALLALGVTPVLRVALISLVEVGCKQICHEIKDKGLVDISPRQEEITYGQPNFHHSVRKTLSMLTERGEVDR